MRHFRPNSSRSNASNNSSTLNLSESPLPQHRYTIDDALETIGYGWFQIRMYDHILSPTFRSLLYLHTKKRLIISGGLWASNAAEIVILSFVLPIIKDEWNLEQGINGIVGASVFLGMLIGSMLWTHISDKYGRKRAITFCLIGQIVFGVVCGLLPNVYWLAVFRFFVGICLSGYAVAFKLYSESCPKGGDRNKLFFKQLYFWVIGCVLNTFMIWITLLYLNWRWIFINHSILLFILLLFLLCTLQESLRWIANNKDIDDAHIILMKASKLNDRHLPNGSLKSSDRIFSFVTEITHSPKISLNKFQVKQLFASRYYVTSITLFLICFCCIFGYYGLCMLSYRVFIDINDSNVSLKIFITSLAEIPCLFIATRFGVKSVLIGTFIIFSLCVFGLMILNESSDIYVDVALIFIARLAIFDASLIVYIYVYSHYSSILRDDAIELLYFVGRIAGIITVFVSQSDNINWALYIYGLCGIISLIACCTLKKFSTIHRRSQLMMSADYKQIEYQMHTVDTIDEDKVDQDAIHQDIVTTK